MIYIYIAASLVPGRPAGPISNLGEARETRRSFASPQPSRRLLYAIPKRLTSPTVKQTILEVQRQTKKKGSTQTTQKELLQKYSKGFCEICGIFKEHIPKNETMVAHHVIEYRSEGTSERDNIWILCTRCHTFIHFTRDYITSHLLNGKSYDFGKDPGGTEET
jgi:5-methylcytosine-specific restriction endonuclease McrA